MKKENKSKKARKPSKSQSTKLKKTSVFEDISLFNAYIAGLMFVDNWRARHVLLKKGLRLELFHDRENPYDENAVALFMRNGFRVGWVPKDMNKPIVEMLDSGVNLYAIVLKGYEKETDSRVKIAIMLHHDPEENTAKKKVEEK